MRRFTLFAARITLCVVALLLISACSSTSDEAATPTYDEIPPEQLYSEAQASLADNNYRKAAKAFEEVERQHPYSEWATRAKLMAAYSYYEANAYDEALVSLEEFISLHPGHKDTPYAYYLVALSYYEQISDVGRDQSLTQYALDSLQEVVDRFPDSPYGRDSKLKIDLTRDHLAGKEMEIGRYYLNKGQHLAALNRFRSVVQEYQTTTHIPEALHRMVECYLSMGLEGEATATAAVLGHNFPGSDWYEDTYALLKGSNLEPKRDDSSWIGKAWESVF